MWPHWSRLIWIVISRSKPCLCFFSATSSLSFRCDSLTLTGTNQRPVVTILVRVLIVDFYWYLPRFTQVPIFVRWISPMTQLRAPLRDISLIGKRDCREHPSFHGTASLCLR